MPTMGQFKTLAGAVATLLLSAVGTPTAGAETPEVLQLESKIPLGEVAGRIDHMAVDLTRGRLFVAELENDTVGIVDLNDRKLLRTIPGLKGPQGVGYVPSTDTLYVANGGDGSVQLLQGPDYAAGGKIDLGEDADNVRVDIAGNRVFVAHGGGMLAVIDPTSRRTIADIALKADMESFQLDPGSNRVFVNLAKRAAIGVVDRGAGKLVATWPVSAANGNVPMALDTDAQRILVGFRNPPKLGAFSMRDGARVALVDVCADADDMFIDQKRGRLYVTCGEGFLDVFDARNGAYPRLAHMGTVSGARTSLFVPELDRFLLAVRAKPGEPAAVWIFRPVP
jgi:DNA-binding beta-propeller fold protein YncE